MGLSRSEKKKILEEYLPILKEIDTLERSRGDKNRVRHLHAKIKKTENAVAALSDPTMRNALRLRYFEGLTIYETSQEINYSQRQTCEILRKAISKIEF